MQIPIRDLPVVREFSLSSAFVAQSIDGMPMRDALEAPSGDPHAGFAEVSADVHADDDGNVFVRARVRGWLAVACSRCIGPVKVSLDEELAVTFVPHHRLESAPESGDGAESDEELGIELTGGDVDMYGYEGDFLNLELLMREQLVMAVPFAPLCDEACKGLCPQCGADRNHETCDCQPIGDPRLAALRNIKL